MPHTWQVVDKYGSEGRDQLGKHPAYFSLRPDQIHFADLQRDLNVLLAFRGSESLLAL